MTTGDRHCERLTAIDLKRAEGLAISREDREFSERHLAGCDRCRAEREALDVLAGDEGPSQPLDDIARRRYVDQVLDRFDEADQGQPQPRAPVAVGSRRLTLGVAAAVAAAAAVALIVVAALSTGGGEQSPRPEGTTARVEMAGRVVLMSGETGAAGRAAVGDPVISGSRLSCTSGSTVLSFPTGITASVGPGSVATARRLDDSAIEIEIDQGLLLVAATPGREGPSLSVITRSGTIAVTGTVLAVEDGPGGVEVRVIRGRVLVDDGVAGQPRPIGPAEATVLGRPAVRPASAEESAAAWRGISAFDLLDPGAGALVDVRSVPAGADLLLDGVFLGQTPVVAAVRPGHRKLELTLEGREPVREFVDVSDGETLSRAFDLQPIGPLVAALDDAGAEIEEEQARPALSAGPGEMIERAQSLRAARDWAGAARAYRDLIRQHPHSGEARSALVSLGQIELDKLGRPGRALARFDAYLARSPAGPLALEALLGRARALRALGRQDQERAALERFLTRFPKALQAAEVRQRLESIADTEGG